MCILGLAFGEYRNYEKNKTNNAVSFINSQKITLNDVMGKNLPPQPDEKINNSTVAGVDANHNYIRDDVELAIFKEYPNSAKVRAAELQYAQALQLELIKVFNSDTLVAALQKEDAGSLCIGETGPQVSLKDTHDEIVSGLAVGNNRMKEVDNLVVNTDMRKKMESNIINKYMISYLSPAEDKCDINFSSLPN